jgi:hypothetical protein
VSALVVSKRDLGKIVRDARKIARAARANAARARKFGLRAVARAVKEEK